MRNPQEGMLCRGIKEWGQYSWTNRYGKIANKYCIITKSKTQNVVYGLGKIYIKKKHWNDKPEAFKWLHEIGEGEMKARLSVYTLYIVLTF